MAHATAAIQMMENADRFGCGKSVALLHETRMSISAVTIPWFGHRADSRNLKHIKGSLE
jgi:hypothetical protein